MRALSLFAAAAALGIAAPTTGWAQQTGDPGSLVNPLDVHHVVETRVRAAGVEPWPWPHVS